MKVAIIGSRQANDRHFDLLCSYVPVGVSEIISGGAAGADALASKYAGIHRIPLTIFSPKYEVYGKTAPLKRNEEIADYADYVLALWDGKSRGTSHVIRYCLQAYKPIRVILMDDAKAPT